MVLAYAAAAYAALTVLLTYPAAFELNGRMIGDGGDGLQFAWNLWWMKRALIDLHRSPFTTDAIFHPQGVSLWLHTLTPLNGVLSLPLQAILPLAVVYNLMVLASFVAAGSGAFLLARGETGSLPGAFVGGCVFTFCSFHFAHARGHLNLVSSQWLPLFALFALRAWRTGGLANGALAGLFLALNAYTDSYFLLYAMLLGPVLLAVHWRERGDWRTVSAGLAAALGVGAALSAPLVIGMIRAAAVEPHVGAHPPSVFSADLTAYFVPNSVSSYGALARPIWSRWSGNDTEGACFIGFSVIVLLAVALRREPAARPWGVVLAGFFLLSLGPELHIAGKALRMPLPYALLQRTLPFLDLSGVPVRMDVLVELAASVLVAHACRFVRARWIPWVGVAIVVERLALPYPTTPIAVDPYYADLRRDRSHYGVLDLTMDAPHAMYAATVHEKSIAWGMVARRPASVQKFIDETPLLASLLYGIPVPPIDQMALARSMCERLRIRYVITHDELRRNYLAVVSRLPPVYVTPELTVFGCPSE